MNKKLLLLSPLFLSSLLAMDKNFIEIGAGVMKSNSNFSTESSSTISSYNHDKDESKAIPYISFNYTKDLSEKQDLYIDMGFDGLKIGTALKNEGSEINFGLIANLMNKEWENPYLLNTKREETDTKEYGVFVSYGMELSQYISPSVSYYFTQKDYDKETVQADLRREGKKHLLEFENFSFINQQNFLLSKLSYENYDAKGKASAYNDYGLELTFIHNFAKGTNLALIANINKKEYKKTNTIFNKKVDEDRYGLIAAFKHNNPFNIKNTFVALKTGISKTDSNTKFHESNESFSILSVGYKF